MPPAVIDTRTARLLVTAVALLYGAAHLAWYGTTPLGGFPVLDGREILDLAKSIAAGSLPAEPFYRAPLYPALIALFVALGVPDVLLPDVARLVNLFAHVASALLVFELGRRLWATLNAGLLAGVLYALYPVALHFAGDPLDIALATTLALAATLAAWLAWERASALAALLAGALLALATLARPNFLVCLPALLLWFALLARRQPGLGRAGVAALLGSALVLASMALVNQRVGGEFRLLPWQGSHALWDANGPDAIGLYYQHSIPVPDLVPGSNPARAEAEILYCRERPCSGRIDIDDFQAYWRDRFIEDVRSDPGDWLALMARKAWYAVNNYEQYNNKTYWFHKDRAPWLRWNPLGWALLLALAAGALWLPLRPPARSLLLLLVGAYAIGLLMYFVSARFRVPMAGWLCVLAGGWAMMIDAWRQPATRRTAILLTTLGVGALAAVPVSDSLRQATVTEDWSLVASAELSAGHWREAEDWAIRVIERDPTRMLAVALVCAARLHAWEKAPGDELPPRAWLEESLSWCVRGAVASHRAGYNAGFFLAGLCRQDEAVRAWSELVDSRLVGELARDALAVLGAGVAPVPGPEGGLGSAMALDPAARAPGLASMINAVQGRQCAPAQQ